MRRIWAIIVATLLATGSPISSASAATKITLLYTPVGAFTASYVARDQGFFAKHGLDVDLSISSNASLIPAALVGGSAQIGTTTPTQLLQADEQGIDLVIVAGSITYPQRPDSLGILARTGSGIAKAGDLAGQKFGVPSFGGLNDIISKKWMQSEGLDYRKVNWLEISIPQMSDALKGGLVDAVSLAVPVYGQIIASKVGYEIADFNSIFPAGTTPIAYTSTRSWATKNADRVKSFRDALNEAVSYIADPAKVTSVRESIAKYTKLPPQAAAIITIPYNFAVRPEPKNMVFWIEVSREQGLIAGNPDPASLIVP